MLQIQGLDKGMETPRDDACVNTLVHKTKTTKKVEYKHFSSSMHSNQVCRQIASELNVALINPVNTKTIRKELHKQVISDSKVHVYFTSISIFLFNSDKPFT